MAECGELALLVCRKEADGSLSETEHRFSARDDLLVFLQCDSVCGAVVVPDEASCDLMRITVDDDQLMLASSVTSGQLLLNEVVVGAPVKLNSGDLVRWHDSDSFITVHAAGSDDFPVDASESSGDEEANQLLKTLQQPNQRTAEFRLFDQYYPKVLDVARASVRNSDHRVFDEEDIANEAFSEFYAGLSDGRFSSLKGAEELWAMLICITRRRAIDMLRHVSAARRRPEQLRGESLFAFNSIQDVRTDQGVGKGEKISDIAAVDSDEEVAHFLEFLEAYDSEGLLAPVARLRLDDRTNSQIAEELSRSLRAVERAMQKIRNLWQQHSQRNDRF